VINMNEYSEILITEEELAAKVEELGARISADFAGESILLVGILKGSVPFMADLMRAIKLEDVQIDFMGVSSYGDATETSGVVQIRKDLDSPIEGRNVIIVEDIIDTGLTLSYIKQHLLARKPKTLKVCSILDKPSRRKVDFKGDYVGFEVGDKYIVGYGLDAAQKYRNLPYVTWIKDYK
jgi:hypoxanthine phosphoribosyltransferase